MQWYKTFYTEAFIPVVGYPSPEETQWQVNFIAKALGLRVGARVLDLCCGLGRHSKGLAETHGLYVTGVDLSKEYLELARKRFGHDNVEYVEGDMREIGMAGKYDAVINMFTSFGFFDSVNENQKVLNSVAKALKPGGLFLLDVENKFYFVAESVLRNRKFTVETDPGEWIECEHAYDVMEEREKMDAQMYREGNLVFKTGYDIRLYSIPELTEMLAEAGLKIEKVWGDYDMSKCDATSRRVIVLAKK